MEAKLAAAKAARPDSEERSAAAAAHAAAKARHDALTAEMATHAASDPEMMKTINEMVPVALEAANRWTDNGASLPRVESLLL